MPGPKRLNDYDCSLARTVDLVGDRWSILIIRDAALGVTRFAEFQTSLGVAKNILSARLKRLASDGVLSLEGGEYQLTPRGWDLLPALVALMQWGDRWLFEGMPPVLVSDANGEPVTAVAVRRDGGLATPQELRFEASETASVRTRRFLDALNARRLVGPAALAT